MLFYSLDDKIQQKVAGKNKKYVKNNKKEAIEMLLKDQYPISTDKEITIELLDNGKAKVNLETGILTWDIKLGAGETKKYRISYKIKYPKDKFIDNL